MNRFCSLLALTLISSSAWADLVVVQEIQSAGPSQTLTLSYQQGKLRADMGAALSTITELATGATTLLMHSQKLSMSSPPPAVDKKAATQSPPTKTGETQVIDGFTCDAWHKSVGLTNTIIWVARDYPGYADMAEDFRGMRQAQGGQAFDPNGMVVKTEIASDKGKQTIVLKSVRHEKLAAEVFAAPEDYKKAGMPATGAK